MQIILKLTSIAILQPSFLPLLSLHLFLPSSPSSPSSPSPSSPSSSGTCRYPSYPADKRRCSLPQNQEACCKRIQMEQTRFFVVSRNRPSVNFQYHKRKKWFSHMITSVAPFWSVMIFVVVSRERFVM